MAKLSDADKAKFNERLKNSWETVEWDEVEAIRFYDPRDHYERYAVIVSGVDTLYNRRVRQAIPTRMGAIKIRKRFPGIEIRDVNLNNENERVSYRAFLIRDDYAPNRYQ